MSFSYRKESSIDMLKDLIKKNQEIITYVIFGVLTTIVNLISYRLFTEIKLNLFLSVLLAWVLATIFSFITNKLFVFKSKKWTLSVLGEELFKFLSACIFSLGVDLFDMWIMVEILIIHDMVAKFISNVIGTVINYILRKFIVFKK